MLFSHSRLATHYIPSSRLDDVKSSLAHGNHTEESINNILESFSGAYTPSTLDPLLHLIEECFGKYEVIEIVKALNQKASSSDPVASKWAKECLGMVGKASPTSVFVTLELLKKAKKQSLTSCLRTEYATCYKFIVTIELCYISPNVYVDEQCLGFLRGSHSEAHLKVKRPQMVPFNHRISGQNRH